MKEWTFLGGGVKTYSDPPTYFQGVKTPNPHDLCPCRVLTEPRNNGLSTWCASSCATTRVTHCLSLDDDSSGLYSNDCIKYVMRPQFSIAPAAKSGIAIWSNNSFTKYTQVWCEMHYLTLSIVSVTCIISLSLLSPMQCHCYCACDYYAVDCSILSTLATNSINTYLLIYLLTYLLNAGPTVSILNSEILPLKQITGCLSQILLWLFSDILCSADVFLVFFSLCKFFVWLWNKSANCQFLIAR